MSRNFDLLGDPIPANWGKPGRNEHAPSAENARKIRDMLAVGLPMAEIAEQIGLSVPTLRKHYFANRDLPVREAQRRARQEQRARLMLRLSEQVDAGNVSAIKAMKAILDEEDIRDRAREARRDAPKRPAKPLPKGKREQAVQAAADLLDQHPDLRPGLPN